MPRRVRSTTRISPTAQLQSGSTITARLTERRRCKGSDDYHENLAAYHDASVRPNDGWRLDDLEQVERSLSRLERTAGATFWGGVQASDVVSCQAIGHLATIFSRLLTRSNEAELEFQFGRAYRA